MSSLGPIRGAPSTPYIPPDTEESSLVPVDKPMPKKAEVLPAKPPPAGPVASAAKYMSVVGTEILLDGLRTLGQRAVAGAKRLVGVKKPKVRDMTDRTCVVTGANSGIGFATAKDLAARGAHVVLVCRNEERGQKALDDIRKATGNDKVELVVGDIGSRQGAEALTYELLDKLDDIDVLVNNAGILATEPGTNEDGIDRSMAVNHLGPAQLTLGLLALIQEGGGGRIINVNSGMYKHARLEPEKMGEDSQRFDIVRTYADSKMAQVLFTRELARRLHGSKVSTTCVHPGAVKTNIANTGAGGAQSILRAGVALSSPLMRSPEQGAKSVVNLAIREDATPLNGKYVFNEREMDLDVRALVPLLSRDTWLKTLELTGTREPGAPRKSPLNRVARMGERIRLDNEFVRETSGYPPVPIAGSVGVQAQHLALTTLLSTDAQMSWRSAQTIPPDLVVKWTLNPLSRIPCLDGPIATADYSSRIESTDAGIAFETFKSNIRELFEATGIRVRPAGPITHGTRIMVEDPGAGQKKPPVWLPVEVEIDEETRTVSFHCLAGHTFRGKNVFRFEEDGASGTRLVQHSEFQGSSKMVRLGEAMGAMERQSHVWELFHQKLFDDLRVMDN